MLPLPMAKGRKKKQLDEGRSDGAAAGAIPGRGLEALGLLMLLFALAACFALFSFDPADASGRGNLVGPVGVGVARAVLGGVGVVGYVAVLAAVGLAGATLLGRLRFPSLLAMSATASLFLGATILAHLVAGEPGVLGHPAGGALGELLGELLRGAVGPAGAALVAVGAVLLGVLGVTSLSLGAALTDAGRFGRYLILSGAGRLHVWREARAAARLRETELVEAARSRRAQAELEAQERERSLKEELEEKQRLAVLKATAKAEEKALKKIAGKEAKERLERELAEAEEGEDDASDEVQERLWGGPIAEPRGSEGGEVREPLADAAALIEGFAPAPEAAEASPKTKRERRGKRGAAERPEPSLGDLDAVAEEAPEILLRAREAPPAIIPAIAATVGEAAEVIERIDRETRLPAAAEDEVAGPGPVVHERRVIEADFDEEADTPPVTPLPVVPEKPVYQLPPINLLDYEGEAPQPVDGEQLRGKATRLEEKLKTYGVEGRVVAIRPGPVVTTYEYQPAPGVKVSKIASLSDDIAMSMEAVRVRIVAPIPGRGVVGIELPNDGRESVYLKEVVAHDSFRKSKSLLSIALGKDAEGEPQVRDLRKMPHLLIAGTTGSGKSVSINTMVLSILYKATPDQVKFIMVDPKMLELSLYNDIPHLLLPVVTDPRKASLALQWAVDEMERRYQMLSEMKVRDIEGFNRRLEKLRDVRAKRAVLAAVEEPLEQEGEELALGSTPPEAAEVEEKGQLYDPWPGKPLPENLPYIVVLIDEFADLMCVAPRDVEASVQRLAQKARAAGIHVLLATQRPSTDVITGVIKNNFPSRLAFRVASRHDSATVLNAPGAENLLGMGDSLYLSVAAPMPERIHGGYVSEDEVERVVDFWKAQARPKYDPTILERKSEDDEEGGIQAEEADENYDMAVRIVCETRKASISALQRRLRVGYNRAARMIEMMEIQGIVGPAVGPKGEREVLVQAMGPDGPARG